MAAPTQDPRPTTTSRLSAADRREAILDVARDILRVDGEPGISIGTVAERAEVTRALIYKHFDNRDDLIIALYRREAGRLDDHLVAVVRDTVGGFEPKMRALVRALLDATDIWGSVFNPLRHTAAGPIGRREARERHERSIHYFARLAVEDLDLPADRVPLAMRILLGGLDPLMWQVGPGTGDAERSELVDVFVTLTIDALNGLRT